MTEESNMTLSEATELSEIMKRHETELLNSLNLQIAEHIKRCNFELKNKRSDLEALDTVNIDYFKAVVMCEYFSQLHRGDRDAAEAIIHNLKGQAGLLKIPNPE